jgi:hypothetical protein
MTYFRLGSGLNCIWPARAGDSDFPFWHGLIRAPTRALPIMPAMTGLGSFAATPMHSARALWTQTCCDRQAHAAQRSFPDDDHRFTGPCL